MGIFCWPNMPDLHKTKSELRRRIVERILAVDSARREVEEKGLFARLPTLPGFLDAKTILLYTKGFPEEIDTRPCLARCLELSKNLVLPKVDRESKTLTLHQVHSLEKDLRVGYRGIPEPRKSTSLIDPSQVDWVLVPGLAFDRDCRRLGRGAGHYDRLLPTLRPDAMKIALILESQWVDLVPVGPHDVSLDAVYSCEKGVLRHQSG